MQLGCRIVFRWVSVARYVLCTTGLSTRDRRGVAHKRSGGGEEDHLT